MSKKITVAGIGGVGGYLAGMLADTYDEVSFIARGERKKSLEENGLVILEKVLLSILCSPKPHLRRRGKIPVRDR